MGVSAGRHVVLAPSPLGGVTVSPVKVFDVLLVVVVKAAWLGGATYSAMVSATTMTATEVSRARPVCLHDRKPAVHRLRSPTNPSPVRHPGDLPGTAISPFGGGPADLRTCDAGGGRRG